MVFPGWIRAAASALAAGALFVVPSTVLAADAHSARAHGHARAAASTAPMPAPSPSPTTTRAARSAKAALVVSTPAAVPSPTPAPIAARAAAAVAAVPPAVRVAVVPALAVAAPAPEPEVAAWPRGARIAPALEGFPEVVLPPGAEGTRLAVALLALPLLAGIWLWAMTRTGSAAWASRGARARAALALQLGVAPAELLGLGTVGLRRLRDQVAFDELTGVARRAAGMAALEREASRSRREGLVLSIAFIDVDRLKWTNDTFGHDAGDHLLRGVAAVLTGRLRGHDVVFRFGGDEFVAVLPATPARVAATIVEDMRARALRSGLSFSYGVADVRPGERVEDALRRADALQYEDKRLRRAEREVASPA